MDYCLGDGRKIVQAGYNPVLKVDNYDNKSGYWHKCPVFRLPSGQMAQLPRSSRS